MCIRDRCVSVCVDGPGHCLTIPSAHGGRTLSGLQPEHARSGRSRGEGIGLGKAPPTSDRHATGAPRMGSLSTFVDQRL
eukprot:1164226-Alexandrium_andersonii.AAC.1